MSYEATGKVEAIFETYHVNETFKKREIILTMGTPKYPENVKFEFMQDKCDLLDNHKVGDAVTIGFNLGGRKWTNAQNKTMYFNSNKGFYIKSAVNTGEAQYNPDPKNDYKPPSTPPPMPELDDQEDIPF